MTDYKKLYYGLYNAVEDSIQTMEQTELQVYNTMSTLMETMAKYEKAKAKLKKAHIYTSKMLKELIELDEKAEIQV